jgi:hypothetical protein
MRRLRAPPRLALSEKEGADRKSDRQLVQNQAAAAHGGDRGALQPGFLAPVCVPYSGMTDIEKTPDATTERRVDTQTREVVELVLIELRRQGIIEKEIEAFLARRRKAAESGLPSGGRRRPRRPQT